ncbi:MAG: tetratricopeptide repeat protein [Candidatus Competibacterales bacterium]|nr:tetratricopeptide repeat protein [Candidatus Competibacterales bacterium]
MISYTQGRVALANGELDQAIEHFKTAVRFKPRDAQFHYMLGQAYAEAENFPMQWYALRQSVRLDPELDKAVAQFENMWQVALDKGFLDVGTSRKQVEAALGEPDERSQDEALWVYGYQGVQFADGQVVAVLDLRAADAMQPATEVFRFSLDDEDWRLAQRRINGGESTLIYTPTGTEEPGERLTLQRLAGKRAQHSPEALMERMRDSLSSQLPELEWRVLSEGDDSILFEWSSENPQQHEITRLTAGETDLYRLTYSSLDATLDSALRETWIQRLEDATLEPLPR